MLTQPPLRAAVLGASGYSGWELVRILEHHPQAQLVGCAAHSEAGKTLADLNPRARAHPLLTQDELFERDFDVCFLALPHGASQAAVARVLERGKVAIDLSADFRLKSAASYASTYAAPHSYPQLLTQAVYGLTEWSRKSLERTQLVANPGCYPTSVLLPLAPWARRGWLAGVNVVADCKSGVSGAGRSAKIASLFVEVNENLSPYQLGNVHRHTVEMEQELAILGEGFAATRLVFSPHLIPISRGMLSTLYVPWPEGKELDELRAALEQDYRNEPFVCVLPEGQTASVAHSAHTNRCVISLHPIRSRDTLVLVSSIDNLLKGAAGQAVQNFNRIFSLEETAGLC